MGEKYSGPNPFVYLNSIVVDNNYMFDNETAANQEYSPFLINRGLSYYADTLFTANIINKLPFLDKKLQYDYLFGTIDKKKRYSKWEKKPILENDVSNMMKVYGYSRAKAESVLDILTQPQLTAIREMCDEGGVPSK